MATTSLDLSASADPQHLALSGLDFPRLYFVAEAPIEIRPSLEAGQGGLCIYTVAYAPSNVFSEFVRACARSAVVPIAFDFSDHKAFTDNVMLRREALRKLITAGAQVPVFPHVGTAQAYMGALIKEKRRAALAQMKPADSRREEIVP